MQLVKRFFDLIFDSKSWQVSLNQDIDNHVEMYIGICALFIGVIIFGIIMTFILGELIINGVR